MYPYDNGEFGKAVDSGTKEDKTDIHSVNQKKVGLPTRDSAKTFIYMTIYGAGATKIGDAVWDKKPFDYTDTEYNSAFEAIQKRLVKVNDKEYFPLVKGSLVPYETSLIAKTIYGNRITKSFRDNTLGYKQLQEDTINGVRDNKLIALDGRKLFLRSQHKALNLLIQSAGAIFMKYLLFFVEKEFSKRWTHGKEYAYVANIHKTLWI